MRVLAAIMRRLKKEPSMQNFPLSVFLEAEVAPQVTSLAEMPLADRVSTALDSVSNLFSSKNPGEKALSEPPPSHLSKIGAMGPEGSIVSYLTFEYYENQDLLDEIERNGRLTEPLAKFFLDQMLSALDYIHHRGYAHRDIKLDNVVMDEDYNIKLIDFGFSQSLRGSTSEEMLASGTQGYISPEQIENDGSFHFDLTKCDIFALGVFLFILV